TSPPSPRARMSVAPHPITTTTTTHSHHPPTNIIPPPTGHHQMARQAHLHPPPHRRRDRGGEPGAGRVAARPPGGRGPRQEPRVARHVGHLHPLGLCAHR